MIESCCPGQPVGLFAGRHVLAELSGVDARLLDDERFLCRTLRSALLRAQTTVLQIVSKRFEPQGVTVLALLSESHASIHTYPEVGAMFVDVFTCGDRAKPDVAIAHLVDSLKATTVSTDTVSRGLADTRTLLEVPA